MIYSHLFSSLGPLRGRTFAKKRRRRKYFRNERKDLPIEGVHNAMAGEENERGVSLFPLQLIDSLPSVGGGGGGVGSSGLEPRPARRRTRVSRTREPVSQSGDSCASADEDVECVCLRVRGERPEAGKEAPMSRPSPGG